ncbi:MAG: DNA repair protein RadC [Magnetococcales bacterium]|nr:DNA repair protein RadC [Magnetococcales bacterium]
MDKRTKDHTLHHGHRERLWNRFLQDGLEGFEDHQALELLLFNTFSRKDTNPLAHQLIKRFGSLSAVLEADPTDLAQVSGIGPKSAQFLSLIPAISRRYLLDRTTQERRSMDELRTVVDYLKALMSGHTEEMFYVLCLDPRNRLLFPALVNEGTVKEVDVHPRQVVEAIIRHKAASIILAHNHPSGNPTPSQHDITMTKILLRTVIPLEVKVLDHVIMADEQYFSFAEQNILNAY